MSPGLFFLIILSVSMSALAQMCLKIGVGRLPQSDAGPVAVLGTYILNPFVFGGLALYGFGALVWLFVLSKMPLSAAYPFVGLGFILTMMIGAGLLGEHLSAGRLAGTLLIAAGCVLVARSVA